MRIKSLIHFVVLSITIGCTPYVALHSETQLSANRSESIPIEALQTQKKSKLTFIDTLNKGKEVVLSENDFRPSLILKTGTNSAATVESKPGAHFRIQVFASSQSEKLKEDKKKLEKQFTIPIAIVFEPPHYKLYAGDFLLRNDADTFLMKIKKLGYQDAWVVTVKNNSKK